MQKFRESSIVFEQPGIFSGKLKTLTSSNYRRVEYFLLQFCAGFPLTNVYKRLFGISFFLLDLELFAKLKKEVVSIHLLTLFSIIN